jgi:hypothetical protein
MEFQHSGKVILADGESKEHTHEDVYEKAMEEIESHLGSFRIERFEMELMEEKTRTYYYWEAEGKGI